MKTRMVSIVVAVLSFAALSALNVAIFRMLGASNRLESRNDGERTFNLLFSGLRDHADFGSAIEGTDSLARKVIGVGVYDVSGNALYAWGGAPPSFLPPEATATSTYIENAKNNSLILLLRPSREGPLLPPPPEDKPDPNPGSGHSFMFGTLRKAGVILLEIRQPGFWQQKRLMTMLLPTVEAVVAGLVIAARMLILRNGEYRGRIEEQKNLVMLGTAASTLAHEIKNPLLAIRLQTGILARTLYGKGQREIDIIDDEVERLSRLSHRVNDILRDPAGIPARTDPVQVGREVGMRLCGRDIVSGLPAADRRVQIDPERLRSILENLVRNALESGGDDNEVAIEIAQDDTMTRIDVLDRGQGIPAGQKARVFDPFFTTKSRGSGIGLAICLRFVEAAEGTIRIEDRPGGGSRARVLLPSAEDA